MRIISTCTVLMLLACSSVVSAQSWQPPPDSQRCPSKWGKGDQRGSGNHMKPETVLKAARLIKTGEVFELGRVLAEGMPLPAGRRFEIMTKRTRNDPGTNRRASNEELIVSEIGQVGTQFDTFSHQMIGSSMYNCFTLEDTASRTGFSQLGVERVGALIARGVLIDVAALKGVPMLAESYEITPQDLQGALAAQKMTLQPGDAVLVHTGWGGLWMKDNAKFVATSPGIGVGAAQLLVDEEVVLVGSDNWGVEVMPNPDASLSAPVHQLFLARNGIYLHENVATEGLAADNVYEFAYIFTPLRLKGATGSPGNPIAIR